MITKFRVWNKLKKDMSDVEAISFVDNKVYTTFNHSKKLYIPMEEAILMQSTGLFDKNGREIFEGDIVTALSQGVKEIFEIKIRTDGLLFLYPTWKDCQFWRLAITEHSRETIEVIGNIFSNAEFLENEFLKHFEVTWIEVEEGDTDKGYKQ